MGFVACESFTESSLDGIGEDKKSTLFPSVGGGAGAAVNFYFD